MICWVSPAERVGNLLGEGKSRRAGISANTSLVLALAMAGVFRLISFRGNHWSLSHGGCDSATFLAFRRSWAYMFNDDPSESFPC